MCALIPVWVMGDEVIDLEPMEMRSWVWDRGGERIPASVERWDRSLIEEAGAWDVPGVLMQMNGIRLVGYSGDGNGGQVSLRGFGENSGL